MKFHHKVSMKLSTITLEISGRYLEDTVYTLHIYTIEFVLNTPPPVKYNATLGTLAGKLNGLKRVATGYLINGPLKGSSHKNWNKSFLGYSKKQLRKSGISKFIPYAVRGGKHLEVYVSENSFMGGKGWMPCCKEGLESAKGPNGSGSGEGNFSKVAGI
jgi:hypothetical protein